MFIRRTTIKSRQTGEPYFTYRLVESVRTETGVRQRTLLNLGRHFDVPREHWPVLAQRIVQLVSRQEELMVVGLESRWETMAQQFAARIIKAKARCAEQNAPEKADFQNIDLNSLDLVRPRSVGAEHVALEAVRKIGLEDKLEELGFNGVQRAAALGTIIARICAPGSELATHAWLTDQSGLGELIDFEFSNMNLVQLYRVSDKLLKHKDALEHFLYSRECTLFEFDEVITLYDLTNTYFEGAGQGNSNARFGHSKEKRTDCPLVTLALVLDSSGFPKRSEVFAGNASEPQTLSVMVGKLSNGRSEDTPTVVLDAGIATEENIAWLVENHYHYVVVSRKRHLEFNPDKSVIIKEEGDLKIQAQRIVNTETNEIELYCHSSLRQKKDQGIQELYAKRFEEALKKISGGLHKKRTVKNYDKIVERIGRLKQKYSRAAKYYDISVKQDEKTKNAIAIVYKRKINVEDTLPGVYCLRTNQTRWDEATLWRTYTMLTDLEAVFRCLKSELGLRPVFHHKTDRVSGHLFISVLAYHFVHTLRFQLKGCGIHLGWEGLRRQLHGQDRVTVELKRADGKSVHIRKTTRPEPRQQIIYDALGISDRPGQTETTVVKSGSTDM